LFYGGGWHQLGVQALGPVAVGCYSFAVAWILGKIIDKTMGFRVSEEDEIEGVDLSQHAESAYDFLATQLGHPSSSSMTHGERSVSDDDAEPETVSGSR
jgi:Amt family ammonium transporter